jgi:ubiquitin-protein ligase
MSTTFNDPRMQRLDLEAQRLLRINSESEYVKVEPVDVVPGEPPERYKVIFLCRGITGIDSFQAPVYSERHEVEIYCHADFPFEVPWLHWITPIWHPNIEHAEPKGVCVNKSAWRSGMGLDDLCHQLFDMVQYRNYHATHTPPYPLDPVAAKWVLEYAEPRGIVDKKRRIFVDDRPFYKATVPPERASRIRIRDFSLEPPAAPASRIKIHSIDDQPTKVKESRIVVIKRDSAAKHAAAEKLS